MAITFSVGLRGKTERPYGLGAKIVEGEITGASGKTSATVNASDIGLKTIYHLHALAGEGTLLCPVIGTFTAGDRAAENYATIRAYTIGTTHRAKMGTFRIFAIGE